MSELLIYTTENKDVAVRLEGDSVWLTQLQMAELFSKNVRTISEHIRNIFREGELEENAVIRNFRITAADGKIYDTQHYNLDVIISTGYRVKSQQGTRFRQWATRTLRNHLVQGYTFNQSRLAERGIQEAEQTLGLLTRTLANQSLVNEAGKEVVALITNYAKTWRLLLQYDEDSIGLPDNRRPANSSLEYNRAKQAIIELKQALLTCAEATDLFGRERDEALQAILGNIEQTMFGEPLYQSREEKAAHLLYFVIKDHPFTDGNKRIGSFLFLLYLQQEGMTMNINENALTALALLVAESQPGNKTLMIRLIVNLLADNT